MVVGAGLAGLCASRLLEAGGADFVLLEARDRIGGRILSAGDDGKSGNDGFDLGPSWFWPATQPAISALVAELGLAVFPQNDQGDVMFERMQQEPAQRYRGMEQEQQSMRLTGGTAMLTQTLANVIPSGRLFLNARVTAMSLDGDGVALTVARTDGGPEKIMANQVIAALPPRLLEATISFAPVLDEAVSRRWRDTPTWMAPHAKFFALYDRAFWREAGLSGAAQSMVGPMTEIRDATTASGAAAIFGFLGVDAAQRAALSEAALVDACLEQLAHIFGKEARTPRATLFKDWASDPLTAVPADAALGNHIVPDGRAWVTGPWRERLVLAGSETSSTVPGYLAGAVEAAERAVAEILHRLRPAGA